MNGQAPLPRSLLHEHPGLFKDHALFTLLGKCLLEASWRPRTVTVRTGRGFQQVALAKGQFVFGRYEWAEALGMNASSCARRMSRLGTMGFLHLQTGTHFSVGTLLIPVCFERKEVTGDAPSDAPMTHQWATNGPPMGTTEEVKKERSEERKKNPSPSRKRSGGTVERPEDVTETVWSDFLTIRAKKRAPLTATALKGIEREATKAGLPLQDVLELCCQRGWQGFQAEWVQDKAGRQSDHYEGMMRIDENTVLPWERPQ